jgi:hypothetical protein
MTDKSKTKIMAKIRKLLALAESSNEHEAELAASMADRLMRQHAIETCHLDEQRLLDGDPLTKIRVEVSRASWTILLAWALAEHCRVSVLRHARTVGREIDEYPYWQSRRVVYAEVYGHTSDVEVFQYLYEVAHRQIQAAAKQYRADHGGHISRTGMTRFREGAVSGLRAKLHTQRRQAAGEAEQTEIVLQSRERRADAYMRSLNGGSLREYGGGVGGSASGYRAGSAITLSSGVGAKPSNRPLLGGE